MKRNKPIEELELPEQIETVNENESTEIETRGFMLRLRLKPSERVILTQWMKEFNLKSLSDAVRNQCGFDLR